MKYPELTNLLPRSGVRVMRRGYFIRLTNVTIALISIVLIAHGVLLIPSYLYASAEIRREQAELDRISSSNSTDQEHSIQSHIASVKDDIEYLGRLGTLPTASGAIRAILQVPHPGIRISGFTYSAPSASTNLAQIAVTGTASTRDQLRGYVQALGQLPYVTNADLPISAYAKDSAIPFTITLTGSLVP